MNKENIEKWQSYFFFDQILFISDIPLFFYLQLNNLVNLIFKYFYTKNKNFKINNNLSVEKIRSGKVT